MTKRFIITTVTLLLAVVIGVVVLLYPSPPSLRVAVSLVGVTDSAASPPTAAFNITNQDSQTLTLSGTYMLRQQGTERVLSLGTNIVLTNGQFCVVTLPAPTNGAPWKVVFICTYDEWRRRLSEKIGPSAVLDKFVPDSVRAAPGQRFETSWIEK